MPNQWVYKGVVKTFSSGRVEIVGRVSDNGMDFWRLFQHGRA